MGNTNDSVKNRTFDAIVIGSGISGGWAAKEFAKKVKNISAGTRQRCEAH